MLSYIDQDFKVNCAAEYGTLLLLVEQMTKIEWADHILLIEVGV